MAGRGNPEKHQGTSPYAFVNIAAGLLHAGRSQWRFLGKRLNSRPFSLQFQFSLVKKEKLFFYLFL
ncbi:hypothetical protein ABF86_11910 [Nitrosomonas sp. GH22]|nr:hypothetical protein [Nitrosomonas sp. GH22]